MENALQPLAFSLWHFEIIDPGPGLAPEAQAHLFEPFQQAGEGMKKGGTGLGLALTKRQVELMGGRIGVESALGQGSRFWFEVPLASAQGQVDAKQEDLREILGLAAGCRVRALVVDDVCQNREVLSQILASVGCEVAVVDSGREALAWLRAREPLGSTGDPPVPSGDLPRGITPPSDCIEVPLSIPRGSPDGTETTRRANQGDPPGKSVSEIPVGGSPTGAGGSPALPSFSQAPTSVVAPSDGGRESSAGWLPDVIFMDVRMPEMDGIETTKRIVAEFGRGRMKIVAISASVLSHEQEEFMVAGGFDAFVGKPFRVHQVCDCLRQLLERGQSRLS